MARARTWLWLVLFSTTLNGCMPISDAAEAAPVSQEASPELPSLGPAPTNGIPTEPPDLRPWWQKLATSAFSRVNIFAPGSRMHPINFLSFFLLGGWVYWRQRKNGQTTSSLLGFLFPKSIYLSRSAWMDVQVFLGYVFIVFDQVGIRIFTTAGVASVVSSFLLRLTGTPEAVALEGWRWALCLFLVAMAYDFAGYWQHRISHENSVLWPFHQVHHSAEVLTPLTVARIHPMYPLIGSFFIPVVVGPVIGVIHAAFGQQDGLAIAAINASYAAFDFIGGNLRHSHLWVRFGPLERIISSPAMHQIHHSVDSPHWNKNYAEIFSLWDWMFGTLYLPETDEKLTFGVRRLEDGSVYQPHRTFKDALIGPYLESLEALRTLFRRPL